MRFIGLLFALLFVVFASRGENEDVPMIVNSLYPSPTAIALGGYLDHPVGHYTGTPVIRIPLYMINQKNVNLPIFLSYHAKGNKVEDISSFVGLGWSLNAGGIITRVVNGLPDDRFHYVEKRIGKLAYHKDTSVLRDEYRFGSLNNSNEENILISDVGKLAGQCYNVNSGRLDLQPDVFYVNCLNLSFKFVIDKNEGVRLIPKNGNIVNCQKNEKNEIVGFIITDTYGNQFFFNEIEKSEVTIDSHHWNFGSYTSCSELYNSSWHLSLISDPFGNEIRFNYKPSTLKYTVRGNEKHYFYNANCGKDKESSISIKDYSTVHYKIGTKLIESIYCNSGYVNFEYNFKREDLISGAAGLNQIRVFDYSGNFIKGFNLVQSHFVSKESTKETGKRLRLDAVQEFGLEKSLPPYTFSYNGIDLPDRLSGFGDFWGYFNGVREDGSPIVYGYPTFMSSYLQSKHSIFPLREFQGEEYVFAGIDRNSNEEYAKACVLEKIEYPTGGYSLFDYELNEFQNPSNLFNLSKNIKGGGLRIKSIKYFSEDKECIEKSYSYTLSSDSTFSSGKVIHLPQFGINHYRGCYRNFYYQTCISTNPMSGLGSTYGNSVGYTEVKEQVLGSGFILYKFKMHGSFGVAEDIFINGIPLYKRPIMRLLHKIGDLCGGEWGIRSLTNSHQHSMPLDIDWIRGLLEEEKVYDKNSRLIKEKSYNYSISRIDTIPSLFSYLQGSLPVPCLANRPYSRTISSYNFTVNNIISALVTMDSVKEVYYDATSMGDGVLIKDLGHKKQINVTKYEYDSFGVKLKEAISTNDGDVWEVVYKYPYQYFSSESFRHILQIIERYGDANSKVLLMMSLKNMKSIPIETLKLHNGKIYEGKLNLFRYDIPRKHLYMDRTYRLNIANPLDRISSKIDVDNGFVRFIFSPSYEQTLFFSDYDFKGNILSYTSSEGVTNSYLWGYNGTLPIAKAVNTSVDRIAHTGFEETLTTNPTTGQRMGGWELVAGPSWYRSDGGYLGRYALGTTSTGALIRTVHELPMGIYHIRFRSKSSSVQLPTEAQMNINYNGKWYSYQGTITLTQAKKVELKLSNTIIDEVIIYPVDAQVTTYTYDPGVGMTSQTDPNGLTTYYEYDGLGRLRVVRDHEGSILKRYDYHYRDGE